MGYSLTPTQAAAAIRRERGTPTTTTQGRATTTPTQATPYGAFPTPQEPSHPTLQATPYGAFPGATY